MRVYHKTFKCSEEFPAEKGQTMQVKEGGKLVERWVIVAAYKKQFTVRVTEFQSPWHD